MMLRLAVRLLRGGGAPGFIRLVLVTCGIALGVMAGCLVAVLPGVLSHRADVMNSRSPETVREGGRAAFAFSTSTDVWHGQRLGRVFLAEVRPGTAAAPGTSRLPGPGEVVASPALADALRSGALPMALVPGKVIGEIAPTGLVQSDELFAYVGVTADQVAGGGHAAGFGSYDSLALQKQQAGLTENLALLVLPPVIAYLIVCGRLAAGTRMRRYAALRLLGLRRRATLRLAFAESTLSGLTGAALGIVAFDLVHPVLASSGALGFSWFADQVGFGPVATCVLAVVVACVAGLVGAAGVRRGLDRPLTSRRDTAEPKSRSWLLIPLIAGLGAASYLLTATRHPVKAGDRLGMSGVLAWVGIGAVALLVLGLLVSLRPIVYASAKALSAERLPLVVRMAGQRLGAQPGATVRLLTGLALLVLVAGVSSGVLRDMELRASPTQTNYSVDIDGVTVADSAVRQSIFDLPARFKWNVQTSVVAQPEPGAAVDSGVLGQARAAGIRLITMPCADLRELLGRPFEKCRDGGLYRMEGDSLIGTPYELPVGATFPFDRGDGRKDTLAVPAERIAVPDDVPFPVQAFGGLYLAKAGPAFGWTKDSTSSFLVDGDPGTLSDFKTAVAELSPATQVRVWGEDLDLIELVRNQRGVIHFGVLTGFLIGALAFGIAAIDNAVERRRDVAVLLVVGMRRRTIRAVQIVQLLATLVTVLLAAGAAGFLAGNLAFRLNDVNRPWYAGPLSAMTPFSIASVLVAVAAGSFIAVRRLRSEDIKRE